MAKKNHKQNATIGPGSGRTQMFSYAAPTAKSVQLAGDFTQWQQKPINLQKGPDGVWRTTVEIEPGLHPYRFLVDGQWCDDPACTRHLPNPYGGQDAVRQVV